MASVSFHHGTRVFESAETPLLVRTAQTAVIGLIGTAPDADAVKFPLNKPIQILRPQDAVDLGVTGTIPEALDSIFDQIVCPVIVVRIEEETEMAALWANAIGSQVAFTGVHAFRRAAPDGLYQPKLIVAPGLTQALPENGILSIAVTNGGTGYVAETTVVTIAGSGGSGAAATAIVVDGAITAIKVTNPGSGYSGAVTVTITGAGENAAATATKGTAMNPVVAELMSVAETLKAMVYVDGPDTSDQAAVQYRGLINSERIAICDPKILKFDTDDAVYVPRPSSPIWAARQARMDLEQGFWWAGSNVEVAGIGGVNRPIEYGPQSNYLNENRVNTIVNIDNSGFRLWGVWTCASDPMWQFIPVRRTADAVNQGLMRAYIEFNDRPFSLANVKFLVEGGRNHMRTMELEGALLPGSDVWLLDSNSEEDMAQGIVKLGVKFEPPAPMTDIRITAHRNIVAYELLLNQAIQELSSGSLAA